MQQKQVTKKDEDIRITDSWTVVNDNIGTYSGTTYYEIKNFTKGGEIEEFQQYENGKVKEGGVTYTIDQIKANMQALINNILNPMADMMVAVGNKPSITSGYRNRKSNERAGGAVNSQHMQGMAADLQYTSTAYDDNFAIARTILQLNLPFDQLIIYPPSGASINTNKGSGSDIGASTDFTNFNVNNCSFIHVSYNKNAKQQRGEIGVETYRGKNKNDPSRVHWLTISQIQQLKS